MTGKLLRGYTYSPSMLLLYAIRPKSQGVKLEIITPCIFVNTCYNDRMKTIELPNIGYIHLAWNSFAVKLFGFAFDTGYYDSLPFVVLELTLLDYDFEQWLYISIFKLQIGNFIIHFSFSM